MSNPRFTLDTLPTDPSAHLDLLQLFAERKVKAYNPWTDLATRTGVDLQWHKGRVGKFECPLGVTDFEELSVSLHVGMNEVQMRCTLTHELIHLERGFEGVEKNESNEERTVRLLTAKRLVDPVLYRLVLERWPEPEGSRASILGVDKGTFRTYSKWRSGVTERTALRVWRQHQVRYPIWPPAWVDDKRAAKAARHAGPRPRASVAPTATN